MGPNRETLSSDAAQWILISSSLLSQMALKRDFDVLGTHYEMTSVSALIQFDLPPNDNAY